MSSSSFLLFYHSLLLCLASLTLSQLEDIDYVQFNCSQTSDNYTVNSPYESNLNSIISQFSTFTLSDYNYGFFNLSAGETPDRVNTIALCRADINQTDCYRFLNYTVNELKRLCPRSKAAIAWTQYCFLRYSDRNIYGVLENEPRTCIFNTQNASNPSYNQLASNNLLVDLSNEAAASGPLRKYAGGNATVGDSQTVYASVQCTPDMDQRTCGTCLTYARNELQSCCSGRIGCTVLRPTCVLRFEANPFNNEVAIPLPSPPSPTTPTPNGGNGNNTTRIIIIVIASVVGLLILNISICIFMRRRRKKPTPIKLETVAAAADQEIPGADSLQFDFDSLLVATNYFSDSNRLGQGGFGAVYKGQLPNGQEIAVKRLSIGSGQGDLEFKTEVVLVAKLQHRSLVRLLGFCLHGHEKLLIYEFVRNGSLDNFIFDRLKRAKLDWEARYKIIGGIARGLLYLHEDSRLRIIHRDLKASNILLDAEMIPKIADFGMARLFGQDETQGNTSRIVGTYGYMAPEYVCTGQFSVKSDVFSFGVLLLEIISGQKSNSFRHGEEDEYILSFAWRSWREGTALNLVDPTLGDGSRNEIMRCIHIALLCVQENGAARPTMASVVLMLNSFSNTLELPSQPAFSMQSNFGSDMPSSMTSTSKSNSDLQQLSHHEVSITELYPR